jgi:hypothetical protein
MPRRDRGKRKWIECPPIASVARGRVALKDAGRRFAVAFRPSLTATRPRAPRKGGRDGGMVHSIEHRDGRKGEHQFPCSFLGLCTLFEGTLIMLIDVAYRHVQRVPVTPLAVAM